MKSDFETWFAKQFGQPPKAPTMYKPENSGDAIYLGEQHGNYYKELSYYTAKKDAALKAWCARESEVK